MKTISKFLFFAILLFFNSAFADLASDAEKLFNWGEQKYPVYFATGETEIATQILNYRGYKWYYRYYPQTKIYFAINKLNKVYVLGGVFGSKLLYLGKMEDLIDAPIPNKPKVEVPKTTTKNSVVAKVTAPVGSQILVNGTNTGVTIPESGEANITLDTSGDDGDKSFSIKFVNVAGVESDEVNVIIDKKTVISFLTSFSGMYKPDDNHIVEFIAQSDGLKPVDMTIKWDDNTIEKVEVAIGDTKTISHTYNDNENKNIYMKGDVGVLNSKGKIQDVKRWGKDTAFVYMRKMFDTYQNSGWNATDIPNTTYVTNMYHMFYHAYSFSDNDLSIWNVSNVTNHEGFRISWGSMNIEPDWNREYAIKTRKPMINLSKTTGEGHISFEVVKYQNKISPLKDIFNDPNITIKIDLHQLELKNNDLSMITGTFMNYMNATYGAYNTEANSFFVILTQKAEIPAFPLIKILDVKIKVQAIKKSSGANWYTFGAKMYGGAEKPPPSGTIGAERTSAGY